MIDFSNVKLLNRDVLVRLVKKTDIQKSVIYTQETIDESEYQFFEVLAVSDEVTMFGVGDTVVCSWLKITPPMSVQINGETVTVGITSQDEIVAVVEGA